MIAANLLGRSTVGIDISVKAIALHKNDLATLLLLRRLSRRKERVPTTKMTQAHPDIFRVLSMFLCIVTSEILGKC